MINIQPGISRTLPPKGFHGHVMADLGRGIGRSIAGIDRRAVQR
jgi:hypothetical protein